MAASSPMMDKATAGMFEIFSALSTSELRYFDEDRYSEAEIRKGLSDSLTDRKIDAMKRLLAAVSVGRDASALFPDVVKNVSFQSLELKKLIYIYLVQYAENNRELALLSINSFQKDLSDRSQLVRASALRAMASIKVLEVIQLVMVAVRTASADTQAYVRKTAAQCMTKVYGVDPDQFFELRGLLLKLMNDHEVQVVGSAVMAFRHIVIARPPPSSAGAPTAGEAAGAEASGGGGGGVGGDGAAPEEAMRAQLALLHPLFRRLCQDVLLMDAWAQQSCIDVLLRYCRLFFACPDRRPQSPTATGEAPAPMPEDLAGFLKSLRLLLTSSSKGVTVAAVVALCYLAPSDDLKAVVMPLLRCLRQAPAEAAHSLLVAFMPIVEARPDLVRPHIREFFVHSFDLAPVKESKLKMVKLLVDDTNVQLVLRELQAYVSWHSHPDFVTLAVQSIAHVALKIESVADSCLRGLVKMLDSKCEVLSCEAVVALRALLQQRHQSADSGLGAVLPHLARYLEDLAAPTARASVVWLIGQYQREAPRLGPDVVRRLSKTFSQEKQEVKQQILGLSLKVWAFHTLNAKGEAPAVKETSGKDPKGGKELPRQAPLSPEDSAKILPRLEAIVDHIGNLASYDVSWDVRDTARALKRLRETAKASFSSPEGAAAAGLNGMGAWYCRACVGIGESPVEGLVADAAAGRKQPGADGDEDAEGFQASFIIGSLAQALDFPLETYRPLPGWAQENSADDLRRPKAAPSVAAAPKSISSSNVGNVQHMEQRVQNPSNISKAPVASKLEDLDLFYSDEGPTAASGRGIAGSGAVAASRAGGGAAATAPTAAAKAVPPPITLEQMRLGPPASATAPTAVVGTAIFGEDDESEEEEEEEEDSDKDEDDADWKYCMQASSAAGAAASSSAPSPPAPGAAAAPPPGAAAADAAAPAFAPPARGAEQSGLVELLAAGPLAEGPAAGGGGGAAAPPAAGAPIEAAPLVEDSLI